MKNYTLNHRGFEQYLVEQSVTDWMNSTMRGKYVFRFRNDYGASVIKGYGTHGHESDLWELAVIDFRGMEGNEYELTYDTPITDDVLGNLTDREVRDILEQIMELKR